MARDVRRLIRRGGVSRLLRRWRIPRVIRHVAKSLFLISSVWASRRLGSTVAADLPCPRGLRVH
ncbi:peptidase [Mycobacterium mantenii]|uniref:Peptidase n=1 Tax=Mycobacterium mantenii TaxID=560555 RepID=A0A1X0FNY4_MYCNT|nr:peptidase [Mycobacterium mantenii]